MKNNILIFKLSIYLFTLLFLSLFISCDGQKLKSEGVYEQVKNAVVVIRVYNNNNKLISQGSGVVLNDTGYVVTNYHLLSGNNKLEIMHGDEIVPYVDIIGIDVEKDILILKIDDRKFPAIKIGNSKSLKIGQRVYAIGSPMGFENTISEGIISGLRSDEESGKNFIQITASISSGSSGGAVVNDKGELIGISTLTSKEGQNLNFAIPIDDILTVKISSYLKNDAYKNNELSNKGLNADEKDFYQKSIQFYTNQIEEWPDNMIAYYKRGNDKVELKDFRGAIQDYTKAIEINPNYAEAYYNRGHAKQDLKDYGGAIQDYTKAIEITPNDADLFYMRGNAKNNLNDDIGAIQDYTKAIEINPSDADAFYIRGRTKQTLEDNRGAIHDYTKVIEIDPNNEKAYFYRGNANNVLNNFRGAIQDLNKAIEILPNYAEAYHERGITKANLENYRGAIPDFNKAIEILPNYAEAYYNRGRVKHFVKDKNGACMDWSKAGELGYDKAYDAIREYCK